MTYNEIRKKLADYLRANNWSTTPQVLKVAAKTILGEISNHEMTRATRAAAARKRDKVDCQLWESQKDILKTLIEKF